MDELRKGDRVLIKQDDYAIGPEGLPGVVVRPTGEGGFIIQAEYPEAVYEKAYYSDSDRAAQTVGFRRELFTFVDHGEPDCPLCEKGFIMERDYLCEKCRYG